VVAPEYLERSRPLGVTVALSEVTADLLRQSGHPDVRVIPPGIDLDRWPYLAPQPKTRPVLFFAGHTDPRGGSTQAIDVAARVQRAGIPVRLVMGLRVRSWQSEVEELRKIQHLARMSGLDQVDVRGHIEHMPEVIAHADVVLFMPERLEGGKADIPLVVLEAVASGRPAVVSRLPQMAALSGVVEHLPVDAPGEAAVFIRRLLASPTLYEERARTGRVAVERRFSTTKMCEDYAHLYREVMGRAARRADGRA
jgi:glycosyltransferase involved in cell wall biosynthesis